MSKNKPIEKVTRWLSVIENKEYLKHKLNPLDLIRQFETAKEISKRFDNGQTLVMLADEVGMGKTYVALLNMAYYVNQKIDGKNNKRVLLVTPSSKILQGKWEQEVKSFNDAYLNKDEIEVGETIELRPYVIKSFNDVLRVSTDYENLEKFDSSSASMYESNPIFPVALFEFWEWCKLNKLIGKKVVWKHLKKYLINDTNLSPAYVLGYNKLSRESFWNYLNAKTRKGYNEIEQIKDHLELGRKNKFSNFLKVFLSQFQDKFEPNVFIIRMTDLSFPDNFDNYTRRFLATVILNHYLGPRKFSPSKKREIILHISNKKLLLGPKEFGYLNRTQGYGECLKDVCDMYGVKDVLNNFKSQSSLDYEYMELDDIVSLVGKYEFDDKIFLRLKNVFLQITKKIFFSKLIQSNIDMTIIDEVHNWKSGKSHKADIFRDYYAPIITNKLVMSATPFQLDESELEIILNTISPNPQICKSTSSVIDQVSASLCLSSLFQEHQQVYEIIDQLFVKGQLIAKAVIASKKFSEAWSVLNKEQMNYLKNQFPENDLPDLEIEKIFTNLMNAYYSDEVQLNVFIEKARFYKAAVKELEQVQRKLIIRHRKNNFHRNYHSGKDFELTPSKEIPESNINSLYENHGYTSKDDQLAMFECVLMRLDQKIREDTDSKSKSQSAHLQGGLSSSIQAYQDSCKGLERSKKNKLKFSEDTTLYFNFVETLLKEGKIKHPKVEATVERAYQNWKHGKKTLVFCFRLATVKEIKDRLNEKIEAYQSKLISKIQVEINDSDFKIPDIPFDKGYRYRDPRLVLSYISGQLSQGKDNLAIVEKCLNEKGFREGLSDFLIRFSKEISPLTERKIIKILDLFLVLNLSELHSVKLFKQLKESFSDEVRIREFINKWISPPKKGGRIKPEEESTDSEIEEELNEEDFQKMVDIYLYERNFWNSDLNIENNSLHNIVWRILEDEAKGVEDVLPILDIFEDLFVATSKILLRQGLVARYLSNLKRISNVKKGPITDNFELILDGIHNDKHGTRSQFSKALEFLDSILSSSGSISPVVVEQSKRKAIWNGVFLKSAQITMKLDGDTGSDTRSKICDAFNAPLRPEVLVCTAIGSEGIDLHRYCSEVIHHDIPWNPASLEQKTGRVDRINSLSERTQILNKRLPINIGIPFLGNNYDQHQYNVLLERFQKIEILMGDPTLKNELKTFIEEQKFEGDDEQLNKLDNLQSKIDLSEEISYLLPKSLVNYLKIDLTVWNM